jgi:hypothetical protein
VFHFAICHRKCGISCIHITNSYNLDEIHDMRASNFEHIIEKAEFLELPGKQLEAQLAAAPSPAEAPIIPAAEWCQRTSERRACCDSQDSSNGSRNGALLRLPCTTVTQERSACKQPTPDALVVEIGDIVAREVDCAACSLLGYTKASYVDKATSNVFRSFSIALRFSLNVHWDNDFVQLCIGTRQTLEQSINNTDFISFITL